MILMKDVHKNTLLKISTEVIIRQCHLGGHECDTLKMIALLSDTEFIIQLLKTRGFIGARASLGVIQLWLLWDVPSEKHAGLHSKTGDS